MKIHNICNDTAEPAAQVTSPEQNDTAEPAAQVISPEQNETAQASVISPETEEQSSPVLSPDPVNEPKINLPLDKCAKREAQIERKLMGLSSDEESPTGTTNESPTGTTPKEPLSEKAIKKLNKRKQKQMVAEQAKMIQAAKVVEDYLTEAAREKFGKLDSTAQWADIVQEEQDQIFQGKNVTTVPTVAPLNKGERYRLNNRSTPIAKFSLIPNKEEEPISATAAKKGRKFLSKANFQYELNGEEIKEEIKPPTMEELFSLVLQQGLQIKALTEKVIMLELKVLTSVKTPVPSPRTIEPTAKFHDVKKYLGVQTTKSKEVKAKIPIQSEEKELIKKFEDDGIEDIKIEANTKPEQLLKELKRTEEQKKKIVNSARRDVATKPVTTSFLTALKEDLAIPEPKVTYSPPRRANTQVEITTKRKMERDPLKPKGISVVQWQHFKEIYPESSENWSEFREAAVFKQYAGYFWAASKKLSTDWNLVYTREKNPWLRVAPLIKELKNTKIEEVYEHFLKWRGKASSYFPVGKTTAWYQVENTNLLSKLQ